MPAAGAVEKLLIDRFAPPSLVVNERYEVVHFPNSRTSRYLEAPIGEPTRDLLKMARPELRSVLRAATHKAFNESQAVVFKGVKLAGETAKTDIQVEPFPGRLVLVQFVPPLPPARPVLPRETEPANELSSRQRVKQLEEQLQITPKQLQATIEQLETSNEELTLHQRGVPVDQRGTSLHQRGAGDLAGRSCRPSTRSWSRSTPSCS